MSFVKRSCIEEIRQKISIVDVVAPYVTLKKTGAYWKGLSPFNQEKSPSFFVHPERNFFKCYSSGMSGDIFRFIQLRENMSFNDAVEALAHRFNVKVEYEESSGKSQQEGSLRKELFLINEQATQFFHNCFLENNAHGEWIRKYWQEGRQFSLEAAKKYAIGFAPLDTEVLKERLLDAGFSWESIRESGLFYIGKKNNAPDGWLPRFRGRLMIPIRDLHGRTIAFTARKLEITPENDPAIDAKYINSPETPIFSKGHILFGLNYARTAIDQVHYFIMVEGQLDAIRCWEKGLTTAIAPQGTSVTMDQLSLLRRYSAKVYCFLDGDSAGQKAALRMLPMALKAGLDVCFLPLEGKVDPDTFLLNATKDQVESFLADGLSPIQFLTRAHLGLPIKPMSSREKTDILMLIFEVIICADSFIVQDEFIEELSRLSQTNLQALQADFVDFRRKKTMMRENVSSELIPPPVLKTGDKLTSVEYQLLLIILNHDEIAGKIAKVLNAEWIIVDTVYADLLHKILAEIREGLWQGSKNIHELLEKEEEINVVYSLLLETPPFEDPIKVVNVCLKKMFSQFLEKKKQEMDNRMLNTGDSVLLEQLQRERIQLRKALSNPPKIQ